MFCLFSTFRVYSIDTTILCDHFNGWVTFEDRCYYFKTAKKNWKNSEKWCAGQGANLVSVNKKEVQTFLNGLSLTYTSKYWIGFSDKVSCTFLTFYFLYLLSVFD